MQLCSVKMFLPLLPSTYICVIWDTDGIINIVIAAGLSIVKKVNPGLLNSILFCRKVGFLGKMAKQKHLGCKKCGANQKQHCRQADMTKRCDIS